MRILFWGGNIKSYLLENKTRVPTAYTARAIQLWLFEEAKRHLVKGETQYWLLYDSCHIVMKRSIILQGSTADSLQVEIYDGQVKLYRIVQFSCLFTQGSCSPMRENAIANV